MWRPAARATTTGTNDMPLGNKRRFGLPEDAAPPAGGPPIGYAKPPPAEMEFFNGRVERDAARAPPPPPGKSSRWDEGPVKQERMDDRYDRRDDRGYDRRDDRGGYDRRDDRGYERERSPRRDDRSARYEEEKKDAPPADGDAPRKRKSRWGAETAKVELPGLPSQITGNVSQLELDNYAIHVRLEEIGRKLRSNDVVPPPSQRSPSPPPEYDAYGRRTNTLELRYKKRLEDERITLIDRAMKADPTFKPPSDVFSARGGRFGRPQDKVYIPVKEFPEINFFGLLVGPRGNSLKNMERQSGAKISIRGKGSVKEGKGRQEQFPHDEDDELHCLVTADDEYKVKKCVALINKVIETAASTPEGQNDHKRGQLRELAMLNGTLRDDENQLCQNCGNKGHRRWECPEQRVYSANVICRLCGGAGHMARDCRGRGDPSMAKAPSAAFDSEYSALMAELGENPTTTAGPGGAPVSAKSDIPPWRIPENWSSGPGGGFRGGYEGGGGGGGGRGGYGGGGYGGRGGYGGPPQAPHQGFQQQQHQNQGYGYGSYQPSHDQGHPGGGGPGGYGGPQGPPGGGDPYASYYAGLGR